MSVTVTPVSGRRELDAFIKMPFNLYRNDPNWVRPLLFLERQRFDPKDSDAIRSQVPEALALGEVVRGTGVEWG